jgi:hypothetical protein
VGLLDKVKQGAEQAKTMATQAAERAKDEAKELNLKRQINNELEALGSIAVGLVDRGEVSHAELGPGVDRIKALRAELEAVKEGPAREASDEASPADAPASDAPASGSDDS